MDAHDTCLTIVLPRALEEQMVDHLLEHPELVGGFTTSVVEGHGRAVPLRGTAEEVRGRARRIQIQMVMGREAAHTLVEHLRASLPSREIAYWMSAVSEFGRFA